MQQEIFSAQDEYGPIRVLESDGVRTLNFGGPDAQSSWHKSEPHVPQLEYARAMLLVLLFNTPKHTLTLGLGAGTLNTCLHAGIAGLKQQAVELRPAVIEAAQRFFQLPQGKRMQLHQADAFAFMRDYQGKKLDVIFSDLYNADDVEHEQLSADFLDNCHRQLKTGGWLVLNCWDSHQSDEFMQRLQTRFCDVRSCLTSSGNWVVFAGTTPATNNAKALKDQEWTLSKRLGFSLQPYLSRLGSH
ncbi:methyltransferase domain-containing protein [Oceanimonas sp. CHS3-5]|uniref:spermidine synthase n=1 Tax=Oceanimonas sp. CHS3-5 TaxID=3068186 RepID=UPI00274024FC|nr:methyltransferase domain-containing protein [Oceanimonas sp. CHS3-5]MDP5292532.1 methyltransferase domain-containing protein [Oceanimonas sp. CHS3-5]